MGQVKAQGYVGLTLSPHGNKENKDIVSKEEITDAIYNWITAKYGAPNETWNDDLFDLVADDVVKTFFDKSDSKKVYVLECSTKAVTVSKCSAKEAIFPECSMIEASVPECSTKKATNDVASHIAATNIVNPQIVIEISSGTEDLECTSIEELKSSRPSEFESSRPEDDSDDEEFSSSSAELVMCIPISTKKSFSDEVEDDTNEEAEDEKEDSDDEIWSPKTIGTTSKNIISPNKKGATSSSSSSTKKKLVNRGEPVRHCIIGLANPRTCDMIVKKNLESGRRRDIRKATSSDQAVLPTNFELLLRKVVSNVIDDERVFKQILKEGEGVSGMITSSGLRQVSTGIAQGPYKVPTNEKYRTLYGMLLKKEPDYSYLRVVGCFVVATNPRVPDEFAPKGVPCVFLGYPAHQKASSSKLSRDQTSNPTSSTNPTPKGRVRRSFKQKVENSNFEEHLPPVATMTDNHTMAEMLRPARRWPNFQQKFDESFHEAWERYKDLLRACPHHDFTELHQLDTFYNTLNPTDQDSLNAAAGGNLLENFPQDALTIIENKSKVLNKQTSDVTTAMTAMLKQLQANPPPAQVKVVEEICVTCGGVHPYYQCLAAGGNTFLEFRDNIQAYISSAAGNYNQEQPYQATTQSNQNFHLNELEKIKRMNDVSMKAMQNQIDMVKNKLRNEMKTTIQTSLSNQTNEIKNMMANLLQMNTASTSGSGSLPGNTVANPKGELKAITTRSGLVTDGPTVPTPPKSVTPEEDECVEETYTAPDLAEYIIKIPPPPVQKPKPPKMLKALLSNKEKLQELANTPLNENCSAVILKKLPEKLGDPGKFLIPCGFGLPYLIPTRMTLKLDNRAICTPDGIARDVFVPVGKFTFPADFVVVDYESDPRVPLILGRPFLRTARALIDIHGEEMILHQDSLNAAAGGNLLEKSPQDALTIIENNSKVKAVEEIYVTYGGAHPYYPCLVAGGNTFPEFRDNIQGYVSAAIGNYNQGNPGYRPQGVANQMRPPEETYTDPDLAEYTIKVPPPPVQKPKPSIQRHFVLHIRDSPPSNILPFLRTARALIDVHGEEMILCDGDERLTLNMKHDIASYSNHPHRESVNLINIFTLPSKDCLEVSVSHKQNGNPTFSLHKEITSPEVTHEIHDSKGTTYSSYSLLEEFTDELALITYPPDYNDNRKCDIESDLREIEFLLYQGEDSDLKDLITKTNLTNLDDLFIDPTPEMFTDEHAPDYSFLPRFDVYDDDFLEDESDADNLNDDLFDSNGEKIKDSELLIDQLDLPCDILPYSENDSFNSWDFSRDDDFPSPDNEDKVFNPGILIHEKSVKIITRVSQEKKLAIYYASLMFEDFDPPFYELLVFKDVPNSMRLLLFSSENEEKVFKPGIYTSEKVHSYFLLELSHPGYHVFKVNLIFIRLMKIFHVQSEKNTPLLDVLMFHFYPP
nr:hypothetical protein [Tanacetum cinerariifolium]